MYADSSALVKLVIDEAESDELERHLSRDARLVTSRLATVEVARAVRIANPDDAAEEEAATLVASCLLIDVTRGLLAEAARLTSKAIRTLDAIHLATARHADADELVAYDRRLLTAAAELGLRTVAPGA